MCIIVAKPSGVAMPSWKTLQTCFKNNNDGGGFAYLHNGEVHYKKGLMSFTAFKKAIKALDIDRTDTTMVFHFRIGTSGTNSQGLTHPFKICDNFSTMKKTEGDGDVLFHNGVLYKYNPPKNNVEDINDTMNFTKKIINGLPKNWEKNDTIKLLVGDALGSSKLAILKSNGLTLLGNFEEDNGVYYSNTSYQPRPKVKKTEWGSYYTPYYSSHRGTDYYDDWWEYPKATTKQTSRETSKYLEDCDKAIKTYKDYLGDLI